MSREIKFRVWDKSHKQFLPTENYNIHSRTSFGSFGIMRKDWKNYSEGEYFYDNSQILEQFTGLKDKNGVDIYEGDIVNDTVKGFSARKSVVQWDSVNPCFVLKRIDYKYNYIDYEYDFVKCDLMTIEVIGNIHEIKK